MENFSPSRIHADLPGQDASAGDARTIRKTTRLPRKAKDAPELPVLELAEDEDTDHLLDEQA